MATSVYPLSVLPCAVKERTPPCRGELVRRARNSRARRTVQELAAVSDENSRRKLHNVVVNSSAKFGNLNGSLLHLATFSGDADAYVDIVLDAPVLGAGAFVGLFAGHS